MSSWIGDWERNLIPPRGKSQRKREEIHCKLGRHQVPAGVPVAWLTQPMGLSCVPCIQEAGLKVPDPEPPAAAPAPKVRVPRPRRSRVPAVQPAAAPKVQVPAQDPDAWRKDPTHWRHGKKWTYDHWKCKCGPCTTAATRAGVARRKRQRARQSGLELAA